jgi:AcrR family transcriptional regulator
MTDETAIGTKVEGRRRGRPRNDDTRQAILRAAYELLEEGGMARFTIEGVAERSGAAKTTIYRWWPSKGVLAMEAYHAEVAATLSITDSPSAIADLRRLLHLLAKVFTSKTGRVLAGLIAEGQTDPETLAAYREGVLEPRRAVVRRMLRRGIASGELRRDLDLDATLDAFYGSLLARLLLKYAPMDDAYVDGLADTILRGIAAEDPSSPARPVADR